jgi:hypothetical protein
MFICTGECIVGTSEDVMEDDAGVEGTIHEEVSATDIVPIDLDGVRVRSDALELAILLQSTLEE